MDTRMEALAKNKKAAVVAKTITGNEKKGAKAQGDGLSVQRIHTRPGIDPLEEMEYEKRSSKIKNPDGSIVFETNNAEIPKSWSQLASDIAISKYFRKAGVPQTGSEMSAKQLVYRVAHTIREDGEKKGYFADATEADAFEAELSYMLITQRGAFNSPVWFNVGLYHRYGILGSGGNFFYNEKTGAVEETQDSYSHPQGSACFIQSVNDDLMSIFDLAKNEARIFKFGSGTGSNFSKIRGAMEKLSGGGVSSGLMSFLEVLDRGAGATKSGGTTRRAAKMVSLDADHPEIRTFVNWKVNEEKKVAALVAGGYSSDFNGDAYKTVAGQNSNNSVRLNDTFMQAVVEDKNWETKLRTTGETYESFKARDLFQDISYAAWSCADPGVQFDSIINDWHTCPNTDKINGSNPCSEYMFLDDTACNLASINLLHYMNEETGQFDVDGFRHACRTFFIAQEILVGLSSYPTAKIAKNSYEYRPLGLGYANLGTLLMVNGIPYDSDAGRAWCGAITGIMHGEGFAASAEMAAVKGPFAGYEKNKQPMMRVMRKHRAAADQISSACPEYMTEAAKESLDRAVKLGEKNGYRNAQATVLAPTGTIGLLMDCDTTGIEPDFALVKFKKLAGGGYFKIVNQSVPRALKALGYAPKDVDAIIRYIVGALSLENSTAVNRAALKAKGLSDADLKKIEAGLPGVFELGFAFNRYNVSEESLQKMGLKSEEYSKPDFNLLKSLGFSDAQIEEANEEICGRMTVEGCPLLKVEHLPVFDCANTCGKKGKRFLAPMSHIKMMAAAQPFLSGAISKTVNLPPESTVEDIKHVYMEGWKLGLKAIAVYRDGSKMSQPLSSSSAKKEKEIVNLADADLSQVKAQELEKIFAKALARANELKVRPTPTRRPMPKKRNGFTVEAKVGGHKVYLRTGEYDDGSLGEIFIDMHKEGAAFRSLLNCLAIAVSKGIQYGVPLDEFVDTFTFTRFEPNGMVDHENIKSATSVVDFVFRVLGMEYNGRTDFVHVKPVKQERAAQPTLPGLEAPAAAPKFTPVTSAAESTSDYGSNPLDGANQMYASLMGDAPACSTCGHTTVRNGACYRCMNCGNSMGCS